MVPEIRWYFRDHQAIGIKQLVSQEFTYEFINQDISVPADTEDSLVGSAMRVCPHEDRN